MQSTPRVLVVEDEPSLRYTLRRALQRTFLIDDVPDGEAALERMAAFDYDLVLLDVGLPGMDGYQLCEAIHALKPRPPRIVFLTGHQGIQGRIQGRQVGADAYLTKPFSPAALRVELETLLSTPRGTALPASPAPESDAPQ
jgi:DNA-binding response OmpR family regulator